MIKTWIQKHWGTAGQADTTLAANLTNPAEGAVPVKYRALHKYLTERYADAVTLTFRQIEDVLGSALPALARTERDWWTKKNESGGSSQSAAWALAGRSAVPNLGSETVLFERGLTR